MRVCVLGGSARNLVVLALAFVVSWWVYVPVHELLHAFGCMATGGEVTRLEIGAEYGAALLQKVFPFVAVGSEYAGQLKGFDTHGSDWIYLATDFCPYLLTIFIGVPLLRWSARLGAQRMRACVVFGASIPIAFAPFVSITGDFYETGSIIVSRIGAAVSASIPLERWRSDDLFDLSERLFFSDAPYHASDIVGVAAGFLLGAVLAFATYALGALCAKLMLRSPV